MIPFVNLAGNNLIRLDQIRRVEPTGAATCNVHLLDGSKIAIAESAAVTAGRIQATVANAWEVTKQ